MGPSSRFGGCGLLFQSNIVLLIAVLVCYSHLQHVSARVMARQPSEQQAAAVLPAGQTGPAAAAAAPAGPSTRPAQASALQPMSAANKAEAAISNPAASQARIAARQAGTAATEGHSRQQPGPAVGPAAAGAATVGRAASPATAKREAWKAAFRARRAAAAGTAVIASAAAAAVQEGVSRAPAAAAAGRIGSSGDELPEMIPLPLLLGECKYTNPQLSTDGQYLAYIKPAPETNVANVFIRELPKPISRSRVVESARSSSPARMARDLSIFERDGTNSDRQITFDSNQGVSSYSWSEDSSSIVYIQDSNGDENYHLHLVPVANPGEAIDLTPFPGVKAQDILSSELHPDKLYIGLNRRDPSVFDMYQLDMTTLTLTLHTINPGEINSWAMDYDFEIRGAEGYDNNNGATYVLINDSLPPVAPEKRTVEWRNARLAQFRREGPKPVPAQANFKLLEALFARAEQEQWGPDEWIAASSSKADVSKWRRHIAWPFGEEGGVYKFNKAGDALYVVSSLGRDTTELQLISAAPGAKVLKRIASHPLANIDSVEFDPETSEPQLVSFDYLKVQWMLLDASLKQEWQRIENLRPGEQVTIVDRSLDEKVWILAYTSVSVNTKYYIHHRGAWPPELLLDTQPDLLQFSVALTHPVIVKARDGLMLPSYLSLPVKPSIPSTLPKCVEGPLPDLSGKRRVDVASLRTASTPKCSMNLNLPLVLLVHGGPWSRDTWGADPVVQLLANRGYAVLQVNYRASTGYGKRFLNLGDKQWGIGAMQHDLTDAVKWAIEKGIANPKKVCISGGSYGGYATLAGLAFTPDLYACGVDLVGISNVGTFMRSIPPYWMPLRYEWATRVGPADVDESLNRRISPMYHVDKIKAPLMIAQGAHDPRVPQAESDQMFRAMYTKRRPVQYVLYTDEGHGISKPSNRQDYYSRVEQFLAQYLGGRAAAPLKLDGVSATEVTSMVGLAAVANFANRQDKEAPVALVEAAKQRKAPAPVG